MDTAQMARARRRDRAIEDDEWIADLLERVPVATLATTAGDQPFLNINLFALDRSRRAIYFHGALVGRTRANLAANPRVCMSVYEMGRLLPADTAKEMSVEFASVIVFGRAVLVTDAGEAHCALDLLLRKYFPHLEPGRDYRPTTPEEQATTSVYRIDVEAWSGKRKQAPNDFPGAFLYGSTAPGGAD